MRLLFISNFYPPLGMGGYEEWCQEVADGLRERGHEVIVLTSRHRREELLGPEPHWIQRKLHLEMPLVSLRNGLAFFTERNRHERENLSNLQEVIQNYRPDVALIWGMWNLTRSLAALTETLMGDRVAYYIGDYWPTLDSQCLDYWQAPAQSILTALPKAALGVFARYQLAREKLPRLRLRHVMLPSVFMCKELERRGVKPTKVTVIPGAINTKPYIEAAASISAGYTDDFRLLYVGRLSPDKGTHTAIEALSLLVNHFHIIGIRLIIVGRGASEYENALRTQAQTSGVIDKIEWLGQQRKEALPGLYRAADVFLFTSIWPEPFGRVIAEAMASGVAVVGAATGGAGDILVDGENSLTFLPGDAAGLTSRILVLYQQRGTRLRLAANGQRDAVVKYDTSRMVREVESYLDEIIANQDCNSSTILLSLFDSA